MDLIHPQLDAVQSASLAVKASEKLKGILEVLFATGSVFEANSAFKNAPGKGSAFGFHISW